MVFGFVYKEFEGFIGALCGFFSQFFSLAQKCLNFYMWFSVQIILIVIIIIITMDFCNRISTSWLFMCCSPDQIQIYSRCVGFCGGKEN